MKIFKTKIRGNYVCDYFLGVRYSKRLEPFLNIIDGFSLNGGFDCEKYDKNISSYIDNTFGNKDFPIGAINNNRVLFLATFLADMGGHTELLKTLVELLADRYELATAIVKRADSYNAAPVKLKKIEQYSKVLGIDKQIFNFKNALEDLFLQIVSFGPKVVFSFQHMDDPVATAILYMLKKYTNIKVIYMNHGSHYPALGFSYADLVWECMPTTHYVTKHYRGVDKCHILGLVDEKTKDITYYNNDDILNKRKELGIKEGNYFTLSGASGYKFFDNDGGSKYFEMIKLLLEAEQNLQHVVMSIFSEEEHAIIQEIFHNSNVKDRLILTNFSANYALYFQSCDLFIDSFPVSSALTQIELMKWKKPTVVKINRENALFSFHEYFPNDYEYMYENTNDMQHGILKLLHSKDEQIIATEKLFNHYLSHFEGDTFKKKLINIIENSDNLEQFYDKLDEKLEYNMSISK